MGRVARVLGRGAAHLGIVVLLFVVGILIHEGGHGVLAIAFGARVTRMEVMGLTLWPTLSLSPMDGYWGRIWWQGELSFAQQKWVAIGGNLATILVSTVAIVAWAALERRESRPPPAWARTALAVLSLFFLDTLVHTLPAWGLPMYLFFGRRDPSTVSEAYLAAVALGCPGEVFKGAVVLYSLLAVGCVAGIWLRRARS